MTELTITQQRVASNLKRRHRSELRFRLFGMTAIYASLAFLGILFVTIFNTGAEAFKETRIYLEVHLNPADFGGSVPPTADDLASADYNRIIKSTLGGMFPDVTARRDKRNLYKLVSSGAAYELRELVMEQPGHIGRTLSIWVTASDDVDQVVKGLVRRDAPADYRRLTDKQLAWLTILEDEDHVETRFNQTFFSSGDSREPELAGIAGAALGSLFSVMVCLFLAFPLGVLTAVYLEEFAPKNRWTEFVEININNLAAVPSIVFGLLGLSVFLNVFGLPRSSPLVGGMVLALMTLPTIIIGGRAAIKAVPPSIREAAYGLGASPIQAIFNQVLPLAMPGIMTGTIIGTARALGETAPLLMIGMVAFVVDIPTSILDPATALPVQVFLWADIPERAFGERTAAAILVLLGFTCLINLVAILLRRKYEIRW